MHKLIFATALAALSTSAFAQDLVVKPTIVKPDHKVTDMVVVFDNTTIVPSMPTDLVAKDGTNVVKPDKTLLVSEVAG